MKIVVIGHESSKEEWLAQGIRPGTELEWIGEIKPIENAACYIDLLTEKQALVSPALLLVNAVDKTLDELPEGSVRFNGWPGFLKSKMVEACARNEKDKIAAEKVLACFNKTPEWVDDCPGMIAPRVVSMIVNEAYWALQENISHKQEIDTAMKLGANYPFGPFEWSEKIGLRKIYSLLLKLSLENKRYTPCELLKQEAERS